MSEPTLHIIIDSREQEPYTFAGMNATVEVGTLTTGDYSLRGFPLCGVERKELDDLINCLCDDRARFSRELLRLHAFDACAIVVEAPESAIHQKLYRSKFDPVSAWQSILSISFRLRIPFFFADDRHHAERITFNCLRHFHRHKVMELKAISVEPKKNKE